MYAFDEIKKADSEIADAIQAEMERQNSHDCIGELGKQSSHGSNGKSAYK